MTAPELSPADLRADCSRCTGLCCVAPAFSRSSDFAVDKPAGVPCLHLATDHGCSIHADLRRTGFVGCTVFDCQGAGQFVVQEVFGGLDWADEPALAQDVFEVFEVVRELHEMLWYLDEVQRRTGTTGGLLERVAALRDLPVEELVRLDLGAVRAEVRPVLAYQCTGRDLGGQDLSGRRLTDLRGASLRGSRLLGADLTGQDLTDADLLGADLRGSDVRGADLGDSRFLTQFQLSAMRGDGTTAIPDALSRPSHWG